MLEPRGSYHLSARSQFVRALCEPKQLVVYTFTSQNKLNTVGTTSNFEEMSTKLEKECSGAEKRYISCQLCVDLHLQNP